MAGVLANLRVLATKKGDQMAFGTLEDLTGQIDVIFFPKTWNRERNSIQVGEVMLATVTIQQKDEKPAFSLIKSWKKPKMPRNQLTKYYVLNSCFRTNWSSQSLSKKRKKYRLPNCHVENCRSRLIHY